MARSRTHVPLGVFVNGRRVGRLRKEALGSIDFGKPQGEIVSDERVAAILADLVRTPLGVSAEEEFRISIAGAQEKTALLYWKGR